MSSRTTIVAVARPGHTVAVLNTALVPTAAMVTGRVVLPGSTDDALERIGAVTRDPLHVDAQQIAEWAPLLIERRSKSEAFAATRSESGTDVDFGAVTRQLIDHLKKEYPGTRLGYYNPPKEKF